MRRCWPQALAVLVILVTAAPGCRYGTSVQVPGADLGPGPSRRSAVRPDAPLHEIHQVYRMARQVRAQKVGEPDEVNLPGGVQAGTVLLQRTRWVMKFVVQSMVQSLRLRSKYMRLPEAARKKHMIRYVDVVQVWWVNRSSIRGQPVALKKLLTPTKRPHALHREVTFLGLDSRFAWYLYAPIPDWVRIQKKLSLGSGDDAMAALIHGLGVKDKHDATQVGCFYLLSDQGSKAIGALETAIANNHPQRGPAIRGVGRDRGKAVTAWLMRLVSSPDQVVAKAARSAILYPPRKGAASLYVKWLAAGAGKRWVGRELSACVAVKAQGAAPFISRILASPHRVSEYRQAFMLRRTLSNKPVSQVLFDAEQRVIRAGFAMGSRQPDDAALAAGVKAILGSPDTEAASIIGLSLALFISKGNYEATNKAGREILKKITGDQGLMLVVHLSKALRDLGDQGAVQRIVTELGKR
jgi:hypothetical protein